MDIRAVCSLLMIKKWATCREEPWPTTAVVSKFFCKDFRLCLLRGLCCNCLALPIKCERSRRQYVMIGHPLYLWTLNFAIHTIFTCHKVLFFILPTPTQTIENVKTIVSF